MKEKLIPVLPTNYRRLALAAIAVAAEPIVLMDRALVTDLSEDGPVTQSGIRSCRNFEIRDGSTPILGFHDHPNEMWVVERHRGLAEQCEAEGLLTVQGPAS